jgi:hypothetical protein
MNAWAASAVPPRVSTGSTWFRCTVLAGITASSSGCAIYEYAGVGPITSTSGNPGRTGGAFDFIGGVGRIGGNKSPLSATMGAHLKMTERVSEGGPSLGLDVSPDPLAGRFVPFVGAGVRPIGIGGAGDRWFGGNNFSVSLMSPHATAGLQWLVSPTAIEWPFTKHVDLSFTVILRGTAEYTLRVTSQPNELYLSGVLGAGFYFGAH